MKYKIKKFILNSRRLLIVTVHFFLIVLSYFFAFLIRFDFSFPHEVLPVVLKTLPLLIIIKLTVLYYFGLFHGLWRYVGLSDFIQIIKASVIATVIFIIADFFIDGKYIIPKSVVLIDLLFFIFLACGLRLLTRLIREKYGKDYLRGSIKYS